MSTATALTPPAPAVKPPPVLIAGKDAAPKLETMPAGADAKAAAEVAPDKEAQFRENFAKLTAKEKSLLAERQKLKQDREELEAQRAGMSAEQKEAADLKKWKQTAKTDPKAVLEGLFGEDWFRVASEVALEKRTPTDLRVSALQDEIEQMRAEAARSKEDEGKQSARQAEQEATAAWEGFRNKTHEHVKAAGDKYELINAQGQHEYVSEVIKSHWDRQSELPEDERKLLAVDEAAQHVEDWLEKQAEAALKTKKLTAKLNPASGTVKVPEGSLRDARSLTAGMNGTSAEVKAKTGPLTEEERTKRAFAAYDAAMAKRKTPAT